MTESLTGLRLSRFYNYEQPDYFLAPTGGWNPDANPWELPQDQAPVLDNFIIRPGRIQARGAVTNWADLSAIAPIFLSGIHQKPGSTDLLIGRKNTSATATVDQQFGSIVRPTASGSLAAGNTTLQIAAGGTSLSTIAGTADKIPGPRGIDFEGQRYYLSAFSAGAAVQDAGSSYFVLPTSLNTYNAAGTITTLTNAPHGSIDIKAYQSRIWLVAGIDTPGAGTTFSPTVLFFTNPGAFNLGSASADWKDPISGLTNKIQLDGNYNDPCTGLAVVPNALLVFRYSSIYTLRGSTTTSYVLQPLSKDAGCFDARSIVETDHGVYFLSKHGLMLTDGASVTSVAGAATRTLQNAVSVVISSIKAGLGGYATCAITSDGQILVSIGIPSVTAGALDGHWQPVWCGLYDTASGTWTRFTSALFASDGVITVPGNTYPGWVINTPTQRMLAIGDKYITQLEAETTLVQNPVTAGPQLAGAGANVTVTGEAWNAVGFITAEDGNEAASLYFAHTSNDYLQSSQHGFAIPSNATITGILLEVKKEGNAGTGSLTDAAVRLVKAGVIQATDRSSGVAWPHIGSLAWTSYGGSTDLWGATWTPADVNSSGFGSAIRTQWPGGAGNASPNVDAIRITVYYTVGSPTAAQSFVQSTALYDKDAAGNFQPIPVVWTTPIAPIVGTGARKQAQLKRFYVDHVFQGAGLPSVNGWTVTLNEADGSQLASASIAATNSSVKSGSVSGGRLQQTTTVERQNVDDAHELSDPNFTISWQDAQQSSAPSSVVAEIYGIGMEFQKTRDRR